MSKNLSDPISLFENYAKILFAYNKLDLINKLSEYISDKQNKLLNLNSIILFLEKNHKRIKFLDNISRLFYQIFNIQRFRISTLEIITLKEKKVTLEKRGNLLVVIFSRRINSLNTDKVHFNTNFYLVFLNKHRFMYQCSSHSLKVRRSSYSAQSLHKVFLINLIYAND